MSTIEQVLDKVIEQLNGRIILGLPLGLGKPVQFANALYARAKQDKNIELTILTALSLGRPRGSSELEKRFLDPFAERIYGNYEDPAWLVDQAKNAIPDNIAVHEFYFKPGSMLSKPVAQQQYISTNYTFVARDLDELGVNLLAQMVAPSPDSSVNTLSLSCNPEVALDLFDRVQRRREQGETIITVAQVHPELPWMGRDAEVQREWFDLLIDEPGIDHTLFSTPNMPVAMTDYLVGLNASTLIKDNGTLQIGIGALGDALVYATLLRHNANADYRATLNALGTSTHFAPLIKQCGGLDSFKHGLYGCSEMFINGFAQLIEGGVLTRRVFDDLATQQAVNAGTLNPAGLADGTRMHGGFFLGPQSFYRYLRQLPAQLANEICMTRISFVNQLYGDENLKRAQRQHARFINTVFNVNMLGAAAADQLEDGRVISGVGGQYNFVAQAHELEGARSILLLRSTREQHDNVHSNLVWQYGHTTIPRHLRDIVVTEYGVADLRGKPDSEVIKALLKVCDSRFQLDMRERAVEAGKLEKGYRIPEAFLHNTPERLADAFGSFRQQGLFPQFPFGSEFSAPERSLIKALAWLKAKARPSTLLELGRKTLLEEHDPADYSLELERMGLAKPHHWREYLYQKLLLAALSATREPQE